MAVEIFMICRTWASKQNFVFWALGFDNVIATNKQIKLCQLFGTTAKKLEMIVSHQSMFCPSRWIQRRAGWWSSQRRSKAPAWTRTCRRRQWSGWRSRSWRRCWRRGRPVGACSGSRAHTALLRHRWKDVTSKPWITGAIQYGSISSRIHVEYDRWHLDQEFVSPANNNWQKKKQKRRQMSLC